MSSPINQNRSFTERLNDFGPELGAFLGSCWQGRMAFNLDSADDGMWDIYQTYSGMVDSTAYDKSTLLLFLKSLTHVAGNYKVSCQGARKYLTEIKPSDRPVLWTDFFHVLAGGDQKPCRFRVYVHASSWNAALDVMTAIVATFGTLGISEAKTCGPGSRRLDTIVAYLHDQDSQKKLTEIVGKLNASNFTDSLPSLVKRVGPGIGTTDEPPEIEIVKDGGTRHSFGSFYCTLIWLALKTTPKVKDPAADGRHFLDNLLFSMRVLKISPSNPQSFPAATELEAWYEKNIGAA